MEMEFDRNGERYRFLKWGAQAFDGLRIVPPGFGICHQVNLEFLARGVLEKDGVLYPDTLVGTDSHTTMINGLGRRRLGRRRHRGGGGDARPARVSPPARRRRRAPPRPAARGRDRDRSGPAHHRAAAAGAAWSASSSSSTAKAPPACRCRTAPRSETWRPSTARRSASFPVDEQTCRYLLRDRPERRARGDRAPLLPGAGAVRDARARPVRLHDASSTWISPASSRPSPVRSGRRTGSRSARLKERFLALLTAPDGYGKPAAEVARRVTVRLGDGAGAAPGRRRAVGRHVPGRAREEHQHAHRSRDDEQPADAEPARPRSARRPRGRRAYELAHGDVVIAAITSCTNTSNPAVMLAAGLLAKKAVERGLGVKPWVKTSLAPGSRVVSEYLDEDGPAAVPRPARASTSSGSAARPASATRGRSIASSKRRSPRTTSSRPACCRETATSRRAFTRA